ncbi:hypothetical protein [Corallococcus macrosporus]|uniref:Uncharacterized protein n=1 Tax=Corallococcus macrosporus DSM 14697 TaxID=1189310 RepID=A0A250JN19_9BACT|nr:hypothetical protein [Corallococcus macrosporus]ATB45255.1 hypothetical protein MYMAC_000840 [Corallococcus macrosporus DSM 14697]
MGFSDAGAHLRNMAHYTFPLRLLRLVREAEKRGEPFMSVERAVHRLTGEIGEWIGLDAGVLAEGHAVGRVLRPRLSAGDRHAMRPHVPAPPSRWSGRSTPPLSRSWEHVTLRAGARALETGLLRTGLSR